MAQHIDKDALVAEIERRIKTNKECMLGLRNLDYYQGKVDALNDTISSLDTLEVKEVNLNKEIELVKGDYEQVDVAWNNDFDYIAKHFFELGIQAGNPITSADRGHAQEIIFNLKKVEEDYNLDLTKEIEWLRNKVQKGK